jgi:hypothetical protein
VNSVVNEFPSFLLRSWCAHRATDAVRRYLTNLSGSNEQRTVVQKLGGFSNRYMCWSA